MEQFSEFWAVVQDVWTQGLVGISVGQILTAFFILFLGYIFRGLFSRIVIHRIKRLTEKTSNEIDDAVIEALEKPMAFIPIVIAFFFATQALSPNGTFADITSNMNRSLVSAALFWALYAAAGPTTEVLLHAGEIFTKEMVAWLAKAARFTFAAIGVAVVLEIWGIKVGPLLAGLGLFGVAVALGAQDLFKNLIAGMFVIGERRFRQGDWVLVDGVVEGIVENIGFRTTTVRRFDKAPVFVPNAKLSDNAVTNFSRMTHRRIYWAIGLTYDTPTQILGKVREEIETYILNTPDFAAPNDVSTFVRIDKFSASSIDIMLYCFTKTTNWGEWLEIKERLACKIKDIVESAGTSFAFPSQSLYIENLPQGADRPEAFPLSDVKGQNDEG
ncbi:MAG: mechanosensitive ion channel family protein [Sphingomonadales bacterium]